MKEVTYSKNLLHVIYFDFNVFPKVMKINKNDKKEIRREGW